MNIKMCVSSLWIVSVMMIAQSSAQTFEVLPVKKTLQTEVTKEGKPIRTIITELDRKDRIISVTTKKPDSPKFQMEIFSYYRRKTKIEYYECKDTDNFKKLKKTEIITRDLLDKVAQREIIYSDSTRNRTISYKYDRFNRKTEELETRNHIPYRKRTREYNWRGKLIRQQTFDANNNCIYDKMTEEK